MSVARAALGALRSDTSALVAAAEEAATGDSDLVPLAAGAAAAAEAGAALAARQAEALEAAAAQLLRSPDILRCVPRALRSAVRVSSADSRVLQSKEGLAFWCAQLQPHASKWACSQVLWCTRCPARPQGNGAGQVRGVRERLRRACRQGAMARWVAGAGRWADCYLVLTAAGCLHWFEYGPPSAAAPLPAGSLALARCQLDAGDAQQFRLAQAGSVWGRPRTLGFRAAEGDDAGEWVLALRDALAAAHAR